MRTGLRSAGLLLIGACTAGDSPDDPPPVVQAEESPESAAAIVEASAAARLRLIGWIDESDSYLPSMLAESDSMLVRWAERTDDPLRVFFEPTTVRGYSSRIHRAALDAFRRWERVPEIPVDFVYVNDSTRADVRVRWIEIFDVRRAGQADVVWREDGWIQNGTLTLATSTHDGFSLGPDAIFTVALHEIGHLLGLGHSDDDRDVMAPATTVHDLTPRDRRTAMILYNLPPGRLSGS